MRTPPSSLVSLWLALAVAGCSPEVDPPRAEVSAASLNLLHGILCGSEHCRLDDRVDLLFDWIAEAGCPDVVALQEVWEPTAELLESRLDEPCPFAYELVRGGDEWGVDDEVLLSRFPAVEVERIDLHGDFRHLLYTRVAHPWGALDVFATHLASGADGGPEPCEDCPDACVDAGAETLRDCQAIQVLDAVDARAESLTLVVGDFNDPPDSFLYRAYRDADWLDAYLAAGNPECDPATGVGCTSGREDEALDDLEAPAAGTDERIDYTFLTGPLLTNCVLHDADGAGEDTVGTRLFADEPNPFAPSCGPAPDPICWPSDHVGVQVGLDCIVTGIAGEDWDPDILS